MLSRLFRHMHETGCLLHHSRAKNKPSDGKVWRRCWVCRHPCRWGAAGENQQTHLLSSVDAGTLYSSLDPAMHAKHSPTVMALLPTNANWSLQFKFKQNQTCGQSNMTCRHSVLLILQLRTASGRHLNNDQHHSFLEETKNFFTY